MPLPRHHRCSTAECDGPPGHALHQYWCRLPGLSWRWCCWWPVGLGSIRGSWWYHPWYPPQGLAMIHVFFSPKLMGGYINKWQDNWRQNPRMYQQTTMIGRYAKKHWKLLPTKDLPTMERLMVLSGWLQHTPSYFLFLDVLASRAINRASVIKLVTCLPWKIPAKS